MKIDFNRYFNKEYLYKEIYIIGGSCIKIMTQERAILKAVKGMYLVKIIGKKREPDITIVLVSVQNLSEIPVDIPEDLKWAPAVSKGLYISQCFRYNTNIMYIKQVRKDAEISPMLAVCYKNRILLFMVKWPLDRQQCRNSIKTTLIVFLMSKNLFALHTAYLTKNGVNILFPGDSGRGKTTISINLIKAGFICRCDDMAFLSSSNSNVNAHPFPRRVLEADFGEKIEIQRKYARYCETKSMPNFIIFPHIVKSKKSRIIPISASEAMLKIVRNFIFSIAPDRENYFRGMQVLKNLIKQCHCYSLLSGEDIRESPSNLLRILQDATGKRV